MRIYLLFLVFSTFCLAQPYQIGTLNVDFVDSSRNNRIVNTRIYYPANASGANVPITNLTDEQFPVIAFGHGYLTTWSAYQNIWEALVPQGYIMVFPNTEMNLFPSHQEFANDLNFVIQTLKNLGNNQSSIFYNRIHPKSGVMGHSMGGGSAHLAASSNNQINALLSLAAAVTSPSSITASENINIPTLLITGTNDCVTVPQNTQIPIYQAIINAPCKSFVSITGGSHCQMANFNFNCNIGDSSCSPPPTITREFQHQVLNQFMLLWLDGFLKENCENHIEFLNQMTNSTNITYQNSCDPCELSVPSFISESQMFYPNPSNNYLIFNEKITEKDLRIYNLKGKLIEVKIIDDNKLDISHLQNGTYLVKLTSDKNSSFSSKFIKK